MWSTWGGGEEKREKKGGEEEKEGERERGGVRGREKGGGREEGKEGGRREKKRGIGSKGRESKEQCFRLAFCMYIVNHKKQCGAPN